MLTHSAMIIIAINMNDDTNMPDQRHAKQGPSNVSISYAINNIPKLLECHSRS